LLVDGTCPEFYPEISWRFVLPEHMDSYSPRITIRVPGWPKFLWKGRVGGLYGSEKLEKI
jgi:hypothetical protein